MSTSAGPAVGRVGRGVEPMSELVAEAGAGLGKAERFFFLGLWSVVLLSTPYYLFDSGRPQIADVALACLFLASIVNKRHTTSRADTRDLIPVILFSVYATLVNGAWSVMTGETGFFTSSAFVIFNACVVAEAMVLQRRFGESLSRLTLVLATLSLASQCVLSVVVHKGPTPRSVLFFNNPNQLSYYALATATLVAVLARPRSTRDMLLLGVSVVSSAYLQYLAVSRAGIAATVVLVLVLFVRRPMAVALATIGLVTSLLASSPDSKRERFLESRFDKYQSSTLEENLADRKANRIFEYPEYTVFGAGEGAYTRFETHGLELHSSFFQALFSYGIFGFAMLCWAHANLLGKGGAGLATYAIPILIYGIGHQGLRSRSYWITLAFFGIFARLRDASVVRDGSPAGEAASRVGRRRHRALGGRSIGTPAEPVT